MSMDVIRKDVFSFLQPFILQKYNRDYDYTNIVLLSE